jgi:hypothetical protein
MKWRTQLSLCVFAAIDILSICRGSDTTTTITKTNYITNNATYFNMTVDTERTITNFGIFLDIITMTCSLTLLSYHVIKWYYEHNCNGIEKICVTHPTGTAPMHINDEDEQKFIESGDEFIELKDDKNCPSGYYISSYKIKDLDIYNILQMVYTLVGRRNRDSMNTIDFSNDNVFASNELLLYFKYLRSLHCSDDLVPYINTYLNSTHSVTDLKRLYGSTCTPTSTTTYIKFDHGKLPNPMITEKVVHHNRYITNWGSDKNKSFCAVSLTIISALISVLIFCIIQYPRFKPHYKTYP